LLRHTGTHFSQHARSCRAGECDVTLAPVDIRALAADVVRTAGVGLALQSGTTIVLDDAVTLPPSIQACFTLCFVVYSVLRS
jgi:hypothetical protein